MLHDLRGYSIARQENDGDCLAASLGVVASILNMQDMVVQPSLLVGDGETMRSILAGHVAKLCTKNALVAKGLSWRLLVETEMEQTWKDALKTLAHGAVYKDECLCTMGTFVGTVFIRAFESLYGVRVSVFAEHSDGRYQLLEGDESFPRAALLRRHNHFDVILSNKVLDEGWSLPMRASNRKRQRTVPVFKCAHCLKFSGTYVEVEKHELICLASRTSALLDASQTARPSKTDDSAE